MSTRYISFRRKAFQFAGVVIAALIPGALFATDVPLIADTYISGAIPTLNFGGLANLNVGNASNNNVALVKFDLSVLPAAGIAHATLRIFVNKIGTPGAIDILAVGSAWAESTVTGQFPPTLGASLATGVPVTVANEYVYVDVTQIVQNWVGLSAFYPNNGFAIVANASVPATSIFLDSKESTTTSHPAILDVTLNGPAGAQGLTGPAGVPGASGQAGPTGPQGAAGTPGAIGLQGLQGIPGIAGTSGAAGPQGIPGTTGAQGPAGPAGAQGAAGAMGLPGVQGQTGLPGDPGTPGTPGLIWRGEWNPDPNFHYLVGDAVTYNGSSYIAISSNNGAEPDIYTNVLWSVVASAGAKGAAGAPGATGAAGLQGTPGTAGTTGQAGAPGPQGPQGATGAAGAAGASHAYTISSFYQSDPVDCGVGNCTTPNITLPGGAYSVQAKLSFFANTGQNQLIDCILVTNGSFSSDAVDSAAFSSPAYVSTGYPMLLLGTFSVPSGSNTVAVYCTSEPGLTFSLGYKIVVTQLSGIN